MAPLDVAEESLKEMSEVTTTTSNVPGLRRAIEGLLDDISFPGYLQVSQVLELFDG